MTVYAKQVDKNRSSVFLGEDRVHVHYLRIMTSALSINSYTTFHVQVTLDLHLPGMKRFSRSLELFGDIDAGSSSFKILGTKACFHNVRVLIVKLTIEATGRIVSSKERCSSLDCFREN